MSHDHASKPQACAGHSVAHDPETPVLTQPRVFSRVFTCSHIVSLHMFNHNLMCAHVITRSHVVTCPRMFSQSSMTSCVFKWHKFSHVICSHMLHGITSPHMFSCVITCPYMSSPVLTCPHMFSGHVCGSQEVWAGRGTGTHAALCLVHPQPKQRAPGGTWK